MRVSVFLPRRTRFGLARLFVGHHLDRQPPQFVVDQRQQLLSGMGIACSTALRMRMASFMQDNRWGCDGQTADRLAAQAWPEPVDMARRSQARA